MSFLLNSLKYLCDKAYKNPATMLITTSSVGWGLSTLAQMGAIITNNKISQKEKSFLVPQEFYDGVINISTFFGITTVVKNILSKQIDKGNIKFAEGKNVAQYKNAFLTVATILTGAFASNIVTPIIRNRIGAKAQKRLIENNFSFPEPIQNFTPQKPDSDKRTNSNNTFPQQYSHTNPFASTLKI